MTLDDFLEAQFRERFHSDEKPVTDVWVGTGDNDEVIVNVEFDDMDLNFHQQQPFEATHMLFLDQHDTSIYLELPQELRS